MACFADLPIEMIRLIASFTTYESVCSLSCVNNYFRAACRDWTVFRRLLRHKHHEAFEYILRTDHVNPLTWKEYAYAESQALLAEIAAPEFLRWVPQLMALHHPCCNALDLTSLLDSLGQASLIDARAYAFCFSLRALSFQLPPSGATDTFYSCFGKKYPVAGCVTDWSCRALDPSVYKLSTMGPLWNEDRLMSPQEWPVERDQIFAIAMKALSFLSIEVKSASIRQALVTQTPQVSTHRDIRSNFQLAILRSGKDIPFGSFMDLPVPFSQDAVGQFATCHLSKMASKDFIEDSGWSGIEIGSRIALHNSSQIMCITPFELIVTHDEIDSKIMEIQSRPLFGEDSHAQFQIRLKKNSGVALMTIQADPISQPMHWQGLLTPFGFVGTTTLSPGDWFWLWKTSWAGDYRPSYDWTQLWGRGSMEKVQRAVSGLNMS